MKTQFTEILRHIFRKKRHVYLDHNATTAVSKSVRRKMNSVLKHHYGNPSSLYGMARDSFEIIDEARQHVADAIHAYPEEVIFTGCATESNNAVLKALSDHFYLKRKKIIATPIEHSSIINTLEFLDDPLKALREAGRVAKRKIFIGVMNSLSWDCVYNKLQGLFLETLSRRIRYYHIWELKSYRN